MEGNEPAVADLVLRAFHNFQGDHRRAEMLAQWTNALVERGLASRQPALVAALDDAMPVATVALRTQARRVTQARYDAIPDLSWHDLNFVAERARLTHNLANRTAQLGDHERAVALAEEAVSICRGLASRSPDAFQPNLAAALHGLADRYADIGRLDEAVASAREALAIYRELAVRAPEAFRRNLASSLGSLGMKLTELGQHDDALLLAEEATAINRDLARHSPAMSRRELAASLGNLSNCYDEVNRLDEALATAEETTEIFRDLASQNDDAFKHELALALSNLIQSLRQGRPARQGHCPGTGGDDDLSSAGIAPSSCLPPELGGHPEQLGRPLRRVGSTVGGVSDGRRVRCGSS